MSEPKDAAAARRIIQWWVLPLNYTPKEYVEMRRNNPGANARFTESPALKIITTTPPMPELAPRAKPVAP